MSIFWFVCTLNITTVILFIKKKYIEGLSVATAVCDTRKLNHVIAFVTIQNVPLKKKEQEILANTQVFCKILLKIYRN